MRQRREIGSNGGGKGAKERLRGRETDTNPAQIHFNISQFPLLHLNGRAEREVLRVQLVNGQARPPT